MAKKRILIVSGLLVVALAAAALLAYGVWATPAKDRPTVMYFRADL